MDDEGEGAGTGAGAVDLYAHPLGLEHDAGPGHPERPERLLAIIRRLSEPDVAPLLSLVEGVEPASEEWLLAVHTRRHVQLVKQAVEEGGAWLDGDTHVGVRSFKAALMAAGQCVAAARAAADKGRFALCAVRPPGHHATPTHPMGFCLFNNVAVAARRVLEEALTPSVAIVDWDVHHGNGTQACFEEDPSVFFLSVHQSPLYPLTGSADENGSGRGRGFTVNVPVPPGTDGLPFRSVVTHVACRAIESMRPRLVLISAGYDAMEADPLAGLRYRPDDYVRASAALAWAARRVGAGLVCCLEGGYHLGALADGVVATIRGMSEPATDNVELTPAAAEALGRCFCGRP